MDTDQIIPAVYLKRVTRTGFEDGLFAAWRADPDFVLNLAPYQRGQRAGRRARLRHRLVPGARGLGADRLRLPGRDLVPLRRHLPRQLRQAGLLAAQCAQSDVELLWKMLESEPGTEVTVDLREKTVRAKDLSGAVLASTTTPVGGCWRDWTTSA